MCGLLQILSRDNAAAGAAAECAMSKKALLFACQTFPANVSSLVVGHYERIVMLHLAIAAFTSYGQFIGNLRVHVLDHLKFGKATFPSLFYKIV